MEASLVEARICLTEEYLPHPHAELDVKNFTALLLDHVNESPERKTIYYSPHEAKCFVYMLDRVTTRLDLIGYMDTEDAKLTDMLTMAEAFNEAKPDAILR